MIDARRWILVEAWLALGLRVEWMPSWEASSMPLDEWQDDGEGHRFVYAGNRTWLVEDRGRSPLSLRSTFQLGVGLGVLLWTLLVPALLPYWLLCGALGIALVRAVTPGLEDRR